MSRGLRAQNQAGILSVLRKRNNCDGLAKMKICFIIAKALGKIMNYQKNPVYGLTGNIGCGKSTVAKILKHWNENIVVIDSDRIAKNLLSLPGQKQILHTMFGDAVFTDDVIDFKKLANVIFSDRQRKKELEEFLHQSTWGGIKLTMQLTRADFFIVESAIIFEHGWENRFDAMIVVTCSKEDQYSRLLARGLSHKEVQLRFDNQLPSQEKEKRAHYIIDTSCTMPELYQRVFELYKVLQYRKNPA